MESCLLSQNANDFSAAFKRAKSSAFRWIKLGKSARNFLCCSGFNALTALSIVFNVIIQFYQKFILESRKENGGRS